jgi:hypothetical protein
MGSRAEVLSFAGSGPLPSSSATESAIRERESQLAAIQAPVSDEEAALLAQCFGPDDCYGLAWALVHLIETAPGGTPIKTQPPSSENEWIHLLWNRSRRA